MRKFGLFRSNNVMLRDVRRVFAIETEAVGRARTCTRTQHQCVVAGDDVVVGTAVDRVGTVELTRRRETRAAERRRAAADEVVLARVALGPVGALVAFDVVVAGVALQAVVAVLTEDDVDAVVAGDVVVAGAVGVRRVLEVVQHDGALRCHPGRSVSGLGVAAGSRRTLPLSPMITSASSSPWMMSPVSGWPTVAAPEPENTVELPPTRSSWPPFPFIVSTPGPPSA